MKRFLVFATDIGLFYLSLFIALVIRYQQNVIHYFKGHLSPFTPILVIFLVVFYGVDLYDRKNFRNNGAFFELAYRAFVTAFLISIAFFYFAQPLGLPIAPKTNLIVFTTVFFVLFSLARFLLNRSIKVAQKTLLIYKDENKYITALYTFLHDNPQVGYELKISKIKDESEVQKDWFQDAEIIVIQNQVNSRKMPFNFFEQNFEFYSFEKFYQKVFLRYPILLLEDERVYENLLQKPHVLYDELKRVLDFIIGLFVSFIIIPLLFFFVALGTKLSSPGPIFYRQKRIGYKGKVFTLTKFRTMKNESGPHDIFWTEEDDPRITRFGRFLRKAHLDELPQAFSLLSGNISLVGPRAERIEIVETMRKELPYYDLRHIVKPGISGWAQINYGYGASIEDYKMKLAYDLYYIENRSFFLDVSIVLKTLKSLILPSGR